MKDIFITFLFLAVALVVLDRAFTIKPKREFKNIKEVNKVNSLRQEKSTKAYNTYKEYLKSEEWKIKRRGALQRADYKCQICSSANNLNVHHNFYRGWGKEKESDLVVLCKYHHTLVHNTPIKAYTTYIRNN